MGRSVVGEHGRAPAADGFAAETARRWVLHIDMDAFFASCEQLTRPTLRGRPVLVGGTGARGVVAGASYEARVFGARSAMPMHQARRLVGVTAVVVPPRGALYKVLSGRVFDTLRARIPVLETLSFDEAFGEPAELAGAAVAEVVEFCAQLRAAVRERTGLVASVGAGGGKQLAKIASGMAKPDGIRVIAPGEQQELLAGLPVRKLWGIGPVAESRLRGLGIETVGAFAALPEVEAVSILGSSVGAALHRLARGIDDRPVAERAEAKQISAETTFETDIVTLERLRPAITEMAAAAHRRLVRDGRAARTVVLKLKRADMSITTRSTTLPYATEDLPTLTAAAQRAAVDPRELGPVRLVGVGYAGLSTIRQESLFPELDRWGAESAEAGAPAGPGDSNPAQADPARGRPGKGTGVSERRGVTAGLPARGEESGGEVARSSEGHGVSADPPARGRGPGEGATSGSEGQGIAVVLPYGPAGHAQGSGASGPGFVADEQEGSVDSMRSPEPAPGSGVLSDVPGVPGDGPAENGGEPEGSRVRAGSVVDWRPGMDVRHPEFGFGWVQGAGHGRVTVRFESRSTGPGIARTFAADNTELRPADPLGSLS
ncbi:DNA polymerase IV [Nocardia carnea]|uniref:DNA polymerase IV n=1 Tax=Nocardia carnea TaxID=37328 RepID=UPI002457FBC7|nr:DNA polymerase IV [Nocardia carnea]